MKILIATGGSDYSFMAVEKACEMVIKPESSKIRIISVYQDLASMAAEPLEISAEQIEDIENYGRLQSTEYAFKANDIIKSHFPNKEIQTSMQIVRGSARDLILDEAEKWNADLIVVGSLGHSFLSRTFLGSVSEAVVRHAKCSVLVVRGNIDKNNN